MMKYYSLPGKYFGTSYQYEYNLIYNFWLEQWSKAYAEIGLTDCLDSTEFCRHEEVTGLLFDGKVVAIGLIDYFNTDFLVHRLHRNFKNYNAEMFEKIKTVSKSEPIRTFGYLTINYNAIEKRYRSNYNLADLILGLSVLKTYNLNNKVMIAYTRNTKKANDIGYRLGAKPLIQDLNINGEPSDFVYFDLSSYEYIKNHEAYEQMDNLWKHKVYVPSTNIEFSNTNAEMHNPIKQRITNETDNNISVSL
jgi:hypothetical protein